jgi:ribosomal protein L37AE/L43A
MRPAPTITKSHVAHHSIKDPERCPHCNSRRLIRKGARKKKLETVPLWRCKSCGRTFTPGPRPIRNKTYPINEVLEAITLFNRGYTLTETAAKISSRFGRHAAPSTISRWVSEHPSLTTYARLRSRGRGVVSPLHAIRTIKLYHRQVYEFAWHRPKIAFLRNGSLDAKRSGDTKFAKVADFIEQIPSTCPHELFRRDDGARGSQLASDFLDLNHLIVVEKQNAATEMAALVIPAVGTNHDRHPKLQHFLLANDSTTIASEVPIWLTEDEIAALERTYGRAIVPKQPLDPNNPDGPHKPRHVTGHIDFLQVRNGAVHILDYKPDARTNKPIAQLTIYALALTQRVPGLKLFDIKCAWFNETRYCEFFPRMLLASRRPTRA